MSDFQNSPMLLNPNNNGQGTVPGLPGITKPFPVRLQDTTEYFACTMLNHHMHRSDGKRLAFLFGILETRDVYDISYLNEEIQNGNPFLRKPSEGEIDIYQMRKDPKGTMERRITPEIEARVRNELEIELNQSLEVRLQKMGVILTPDQLAALQESTPVVKPVEYGEETLDLASNDPRKLSGLEALSRLRAGFSGSMKSGNDTILPLPAGAQSFQAGIVGSDKTVNSATSNSSDGSSK